MDLTLARRRAEDFDAALTGPGGADGLSREVALAGRLWELGAVSAPAPSEEFRTALRTRLLAVAAVQGVGEAAPAAEPTAVSWRRRGATVAVGVLASVVAVTGVSAAASSSLPGDPFYGLKRTAEDVQLRLADGSQEEGLRHLQFAETRMRELRQLVLGRDLAGRDEPLEAGDAVRVRDLLDDLDAEIRRAQRLITDSFRESQDVAAVERLARFAEEQGEDLRAVLAALPPDTRPRAAGSLALMSQVGSTADDLLMLRDCTTSCDPAAAAPVLPEPGGASEGTTPCGCPTPAPAPSVAPAPSGPAPAPSPTAEPAPGSAPSSPATDPASPSSPPSPSSSPTPGSTAPAPLPTVPLPTPSLPLVPSSPDLVPDEPVEVPPLTGSGGLLSGVTGAGASSDLASGASVAGRLLVVALRIWW